MRQVTQRFGWLVVLLVAISAALSTCSGADKAAPTAPALGEVPPAGENTWPTPQTAPWAGSGFAFGNDAVWPDYIPADIPVLEGEITTLMEVPGSHVRLLYHGVSEREIKAYVKELEAQGFQVQGIVYENPAYPDRAQEKLRQGEYDAFDITNGVYHMRLEYGGDGATYDIDARGFQIQGPVVEGPSWPDALAGMGMPPPERCQLVTVNPVGNGGYSISCSRADGDVDADYLRLLEAHNWVEQDRVVNQGGDLISLRLSNGQLTAILSPAFETYFTFTVLPSQATSLAHTWPAELVGRVPVPARCELSSVLSSRPGSYSIFCKPTDDGVVADYLAALAAAGFEEQDRSEDHQGLVFSITLMGRDMVMKLVLGFVDTVVIKVDPVGGAGG